MGVRFYISFNKKFANSVISKAKNKGENVEINDFKNFRAFFKFGREIMQTNS